MVDPTLQPNFREFSCVHCNGKIRIPINLPATTGPCPHCSGTITSPEPVAISPISQIPPVQHQPQAAQPAPSVAPLPSAPVQPAPVQPVAPAQPIPAQSYSPAPVQQPAPAQPSYIPEPAPAPSRPSQPAPEPAAIAPASGQRVGKSKSDEPTAPPAKKSFLPALLLTSLLLAFAAAAAFVVYKEMSNRQKAPAPVAQPGPASQEAQSRAQNHYIRVGWQKEALDVLTKFIAAKTVTEKLPYVINGAELKAQMESFYGGSVINDQDTPAVAFSVYQLPESDRERGIFLLTFEQPPQFEMKEFFRPLASLEVQYGIEEADILLTSLANVANFATDPIRVNAFFRKTPEGLKLDWETFVQTKYRTFETMIELPEIGQSGVFRVILEEDVPVNGIETPGFKTYRISDPSSPQTSTRVPVKIDSELGRTLSQINWIGQENRPKNRTATIELRWTGNDRPQLQISKLICWEFLHLGGEIGNTAPATN